MRINGLHARRAFCLSVASLCVPQLPVTPLLPPPAYAAAELSDEQSLIVEAWAVVQRGFVDQTFNGRDWKAVKSEYLKRKYKNMGGAREGVAEMIALLGDRYTRYLTPGAYAGLLAKYERPADNGGIGVTVRNRPSPSAASSPTPAVLGPVEIVSVVPDGPAAAAGLRVGDTVVAIDRRELKVGTTTADDAAGMILGRLNEPLYLDVVRSDGSAASLTLKRAVIKQGEAVATKATRANGVTVGVLTLRTFSAPVAGGDGGTVESMQRALASEPLASAAELLIDLRGNPGGHFPSGVAAAKLFLPSDVTVVSTVDRTGKPSPTLTFENGPFLNRGRPIYILVDKGTASAAEVFAAALQGNRCAKVVGENTYGKGLVQSIQRLTDSSAVVLTVARYRTPQGEDINGKGVTPNLKVASAPGSDAVDCLDAALR